MRISLIGPFPPFRGGISDFNSALCSELSKTNHLQIVNYSTQYPKLLFPGKTQYKEVIENLPKSERIFSSINPFTWNITVNQIINFKPDIVVIHYWMPFFGPALRKIATALKKNTDIKIIVICHNIKSHENQSFTHFFTKIFLNKIDRFRVMSESVK